MMRSGRSFVSSPPTFSNDARKLLVCTANTASIFSTATDLQITSLEGHMALVTCVIMVPTSNQASKLRIISIKTFLLMCLLKIQKKHKRRPKPCSCTEAMRAMNVEVETARTWQPPQQISCLIRTLKHVKMGFPSCIFLSLAP